MTRGFEHEDVPPWYESLLASTPPSPGDPSAPSGKHWSLTSIVPGPHVTLLVPEPPQAVTDARTSQRANIEHRAQRFKAVHQRPAPSSMERRRVQSAERSRPTSGRRDAGSYP